MWTYATYDELYHHGIKGQKWGQRRFQYEDGSLTEEGRKRYSIKDAKREFKAAKKEYKKEVGSGIGWKSIKNYNKAREKFDAAEDKYISERVKYAREKKGEKAEFKEYKKAFGKSGLPGSVADLQSGGRSERIYNNLVAEKGEKYADKVLKSYQNKVIVDLVGGVAVAIGANIALSMMEDRY